MSFEKINRRFRSSRFLKIAGGLTAVATLGVVISGAEAMSENHLADGASATVPYEASGQQLISANPAPGSPEFYQQEAKDSETALNIYGALTAIGSITVASGLAVAGRREQQAIPVQDQAEMA